MTDASTFGLKPPSTGAQTFGLTAPTQKKAPPENFIPDPMTNVVNPALNFMLAPARGVEADIYALGKPLVTEGHFPSRQEYEKERSAEMGRTELPESGFGKTASTIASLPGQALGSLIEAGLPKGAEPFVGAALDVAGAAAPFVGPKIPLARSGAPTEEIRAAKTENRARKDISKAFKKGLRKGGPGAEEAAEELSAARQEGQLFTLSDIANPELRAALGHVYRQGGEARSIIKDFMEGRNVAQGARERGLLKKYISDESASATAEEVLNRRSQAASPLFEEAAQGGSMAPLTHQFEEAYRQASAGEAQAIQQFRAAQTVKTTAEVKKTQTGGVVYSESAARRGGREADAALAQAQDALNAARQQKAQIHELLQRAQADGTANAPGAVWSPRLQQFLDDPDFKRGLARGFAIERRKAVGEGRPLNTREYAIIGTDINGDPITGTVPNMKLLMVAKEGLDKAVEDNTNQVTGRLTKEGHSYEVMRQGLVEELDRLNPLYKEARDTWSGETASFEAINHGKHVLDDKWFSEPRELQKYISGLTPADKQLARIGFASDLIEKSKRAAGDTATARKLLSDLARERVPMLFDNLEEANKFIDAIERERQMRATSGEVYKGSQTAERTGDDIRLAKMTLGLIFHHPIYAGARAIEEIHGMLTKRTSPQRSAAVARLATNPDVKISTGFDQPILPKQPVPQRALRNLSPLESALIGSAMAQPQ